MAPKELKKHMTTNAKRLILGGVTAGAVAGLVWGTNTLRADTGSDPAEAHTVPKAIGVTQSAPGAGALVTSYAPVVKEVAPAVVNISTTKTMQNQVMQSFPFEENPLFQRFFGLPNNGQMRLPQEFKQHSLGSGVVVTPDGYILTNNHVVDGADEVKVSLAGRKDEYDATVVGRDPRTDLAVLKIEAKNLPVAVLGDSDILQVGDVVLAIGDPFGVGQTVTSGIVSAKGRGGMGIEDYEDFIQTDAAINPGNSGGALVNAHGELVGINTAIISRTGGNMGIGFAVPISLARNVMDQLIEKGRVERGYLGVMIQDLNGDLASQFNAPDTRGALISDVTEGSAAAKAGLESGDVIVEVNGEPVNDSRELKLFVGSLEPGAKVTLKVYRDGKERTFTAKLKELPQEGLAMSEPDRHQGNGDALDGVTVSDLTAQARRQFSVPKEVEGALVVNVNPGCPSYEAGLRPGDVIEQIDNQAVKNADEAVDISGQVKPDRVLVKVWSRGGSRFTVVKEEEKAS